MPRADRMFSAPGNSLIKTILVKSLADLVLVHPVVLLSRYVWAKVSGRQNDQTVKFPYTYTLLGKPNMIQCFEQKRRMLLCVCVASAFLGNI